MSHFFAAPGSKTDVKMDPEIWKNQSSTFFFSIKKVRNFQTQFFLDFDVSGRRELAKSSQNDVLSFKIEGCTVSQKNADFAKIRPKLTPPGTPETMGKSKNHHGTHSDTMHEKKKKKREIGGGGGNPSAPPRETPPPTPLSAEPRRRTPLELKLRLLSRILSSAKA